MNFFEHMYITDRVKAGEATQEDAAALLKEVNSLRQERNKLYSQIMHAFGLVKTTYLASQEALNVLDQEAEKINVSMRVETNTD